jgi:hypothetical protein
MHGISPGDVVIVHCQAPKEKMWGLLVRLDAVGVVLRGIMLDSVEDWLRQQASDEPATIGPSTVFLPMHRVQRVDMDDTSSAVPSFADRYRSMCGGLVTDALAGGAGVDAS